MTCKYSPRDSSYIFCEIRVSKVPFGNFKSIMGFIFFPGTSFRFTPRLTLFLFQADLWLKVTSVTNKMHYCTVFWFVIDGFIQLYSLKFAKLSPAKPIMLLNENHGINAIDLSCSEGSSSISDQASSCSKRDAEYFFHS